MRKTALCSSLKRVEIIKEFGKDPKTVQLVKQGYKYFIRTPKGKYPLLFNRSEQELIKRFDEFCKSKRYLDEVS
jgi:hypothetical protein